MLIVKINLYGEHKKYYEKMVKRPEQIARIHASCHTQVRLTHRRINVCMLIRKSMVCSDCNKNIFFLIVHSAGGMNQNIG